MLELSDAQQMDTLLSNHHRNIHDESVLMYYIVELLMVVSGMLE